MCDVGCVILSVYDIESVMSVVEYWVCDVECVMSGV